MIIVIDFGGQYAHLIARRVREFGVYSEILPHDVNPEKVQSMNPTGIILSGGPASIYEENAPQMNEKILQLGIPVLGICYGHQLMARAFEGTVSKGKVGEYGKVNVKISDKNNLFEKLNSVEQAWFSHRDAVVDLPKDFTITASTADCPIAGFANSNKKLFGIQFHPEVTHTPSGMTVLSNFIFKIADSKKDWEIGDVCKRLIAETKKEVGNDLVLIGVSGGVDSLVAASLIHHAIGDNLHCVFIDSGLMRKNEVKDIENFYNRAGFKNFHSVNAQSAFLDKLTGVTDPEEKRKIIGHTFVRVFEKTAKELQKEKKIKFLAQGTIYPDRVESAVASHNSAKIKSHHNTALPDDIDFVVIEPLKDLYKDEVRALGHELGLPKEMIWRHPFPGPGLAIRILGDITGERLEILREADFVYINELKKANLYDKIWQAFAALIPVKTVGVMGDSRTYEYIITIRAVTSNDGMTADWYRIPDNILENISNGIINNVKGVNRVLFDISQKPPATIEYE